MLRRLALPPFEAGLTPWAATPTTFCWSGGGREKTMWCFWSAKGGSGCTTVATAVSLLMAKKVPTLLVDLGDDAPTMLGVDTPAVGLFDWLHATTPPPDALSRMEIVIGPQLSLLPAGRSSALGGEEVVSEPARLLGALLHDDGRLIVVDVGVERYLSRALLQRSDRSYLVTKACYLSMAKAVASPRPDGVVVIREPGRLLTNDDVAASWNAPVVASLRWDPAVAVANDVGSLTRQLPRSLRRLSPLLRGDLREV